MIWGVGAFRSATKSLALDLGGEHEPRPKIVDVTDLNKAIGIIRERFEKGVPVVDAAQSHLIHLIQAVDPEPEFVWVVRNPLQVVNSLTLASGVLKVHDKSGWKSLFTEKPQVPRIQAFTEYWINLNDSLLEHYNTNNWRVVLAPSLGNYVNDHTHGKMLESSEAEYVYTMTEPLWSLLRQLASKK